MEHWYTAGLKQRTANKLSTAEAVKDAEVYGTGWLIVDEFGNLKRIDPTLITIHVNPEPDHV